MVIGLEGIGDTKGEYDGRGMGRVGCGEVLEIQRGEGMGRVGCRNVFIGINYDKLKNNC